MSDSALPDPASPTPVLGKVIFHIGKHPIAVLFGIGLVCLQILIENVVLHSVARIPDQDLALTPIYYRSRFGKSDYSRNHSPQTAKIVIMRRSSAAISTRCAARGALFDLLSHARGWARGIVIDLALDPAENCDGLSAKLVDEMRTLCAGPAGIPIVLGVSPMDKSVKLEGDQCGSGSVEVRENPLEIPLTFKRPQRFEDGLAMAFARLLIPDRLPALDPQPREEESVFIRRNSGALQSGPIMTDDEAIEALTKASYGSGSLYNRLRSIWVIGGEGDFQFTTDEGTPLYGYDVQAAHIEALLMPTSYMRPAGKFIEISAVIITGALLWLIESLKHSTFWKCLVMCGLLAGIVIGDFLLIHLAGLYYGWTTVSILTILGWVVSTVKETKRVSPLFEIK